MIVKSMIFRFLIAVVASTGTYFLALPPGGAYAGDLATPMETGSIIQNVTTDCIFFEAGRTSSGTIPTVTNAAT